MADVPITKMVIASRLSEVPAVQQAILDEVKCHGYGQDTLFAVRLALEEALSNAIRHGNGEDPTKKVTIEYAVTDQRIEVSIADEGHGFQPDTLPDPTDDENLARPHGRGVMLMQAYMNEISYNDRGNRVTMVRTREAEDSAT
ncbi:MAG: ATP-binding protein [bacterium]